MSLLVKQRVKGEMGPSPKKFTSWLVMNRLFVLLALLALVGAIGLSVLIHKMVNDNVMEKADSHFNRHVEFVERVLLDRMNAYERELSGYAALFAHSSELTREEYRNYFNMLRKKDIYRGIQAVGFAKRVGRAELGGFTLKMRAEGFPDFAVNPPGEREEYFPVTYIEPFTGRNLRAFGYDIYSENVRKVAIDSARDNEMAVLTGKITLVQETGGDVQPGLLLIYPIYRHGAPNETEAERRAAFAGFVYTALRLGDLMKETLPETILEDVAVDIFDGYAADDKNLLYRSPRLAPVKTATPLFRKLVREPVGHRTWTIRFTSLPAFESSMDRRKAHFAFLSVMIISALAVCAVFLILILRRNLILLDAEKEESQRLNRILTMLSEVNQRLVRAKSENELLSAVTDVIIKVGGYRMAWAGYLDSGRKTVQPVAVAGYEDGYLATLNINLADPEKGKGPTSRAILTGVPQAVRDIETDPAFPPWRAEALKRGYKSMMALPLPVDGSVIGTLNIYSDWREAFDEREAALLEELANDLAFGIQALRLAAARKAAEEEAKRLARFPLEDPNPVMRFTNDGVITFANSASIPLLAEWGAKPGQALTGDKKKIIEAVTASGFPLEVETQSGDGAWYSLEFVPLMDEKYVNVYGRDITMRKRVEIALTESKGRFEAIAETAVDAIIQVDEAGNITYWNPSAGHMFGFTENEAIGKPIHDLVVPSAYRRLAHSSFNEFAATGRLKFAGKAREVVGMRRDGSEFPVELSIAPVKIGGRLGAVGIVRDITERKRAEEALTTSRARLIEAQEIAKVGSWEWNLDTGENEWSSETRRIFGMSETAPITHDLFISLIHPDDRDRVAAEVKEAFSDDRSKYSSDYRIIRRDGAEIFIHATAKVSRGPGGRPIRVVGTVMDITERRKLEMSLKEANEQLQNSINDLRKAQKMLIRSEKLASLGQLSAGVAHEIKNPLNIISTSAQLMLMEDNVPEDVQQACRVILDQVNRAVKITDNLRSFARERKPEIREINLHEFLDKTLALVAYEMNSEGIRIEKRYAGATVWINGDEDQLAQVFLNIISNARDSMNHRRKMYTYEEAREIGWEARLTITTSVNGSMVKVGFRDTGIGIPEEAKKRIFEPFFSTKEEGKGTGLGLAITYGIVENHGGTIEFESEEGKGASFIVTLPVRDGKKGEIKTAEDV